MLLKALCVYTVDRCARVSVAACRLDYGSFRWPEPIRDVRGGAEALSFEGGYLLQAFPHPFPP
jgi:hypothetical protein